MGTNLKAFGLTLLLMGLMTLGVLVLKNNLQFVYNILMGGVVIGTFWYSFIGIKNILKS